MTQHNVQSSLIAILALGVSCVDLLSGGSKGSGGRFILPVGRNTGFCAHRQRSDLAGDYLTVLSTSPQNDCFENSPARNSIRPANSQ